MSKSKYTNTANAGRLRRRGQSVPKNLLTSEDRFIDGTNAHHYCRPIIAGPGRFNDRAFRNILEFYEVNSARQTVKISIDIVIRWTTQTDVNRANDFRSVSR